MLHATVPTVGPLSSTMAPNQRTRGPSSGAAPAPQQHYRKSSKKKIARRPTLWCWIGGGVLLTVAVASTAIGVYLYRERYPAEQRCPPESDRFYDHCKEGRKHYMLSLDWDCESTPSPRHMHQSPSHQRTPPSMDDAARSLKGAPLIT